MKTRDLDPKNLGPKEDWDGNNIAFECPVCRKVYLVSGLLKHERLCPSCGKSRGMVAGGRESGGKASITWEDSPVFEMGQSYSRAEIREVMGGSEVEYLPTVDDRVVCGCFTREYNPEAPDIVIVGTGPVIEHEAETFCKQVHPVPIFIKHQPNDWKYVGHYKAERFSTDPAEFAAHHRGSVTPLNEVTRVIFLKRGA